MSAGPTQKSAALAESAVNPRKATAQDKAIKIVSVMRPSGRDFAIPMILLIELGPTPRAQASLL
jgi:hypothetical protein